MALFHQIKNTEPPKPSAAPKKDIPTLEPEPVAAERPKRGRKASEGSKKLLTLRIDPDVIEWFKAFGEGWQVQINDALREKAGLKPKEPK